MPKYKEITINLQMSPEIILGETIKKALAVNASEQIKNQIKTANANEPEQVEQ